MKFWGFRGFSKPCSQAWGAHTQVLQELPKPAGFLLQWPWAGAALSFSRFNQRITAPSRQGGTCSSSQATQEWAGTGNIAELLIYVNGVSETFGKARPSGPKRQAAWKHDIVEMKSTGEWHCTRGYLNISATKNGLDCFPKWAFAEQRESLWFQGFLKYFWNETLWNVLWVLNAAVLSSTQALSSHH